jgi:hypothetical protein
MADNARMLKGHVDVHLARRVLHVVSLLVLFPLVVDLVDFARHVAVLVQVEGVPDFAEK